MIRTGVLTFVLGIAAATTSAAQVGSGRSGHSTEVDHGQAVAMQAIAFFGNCYAGSAPQGALRLIATAPGSREEADVFRQVVSAENASCIPGGGRLTTQPTLIRGAMAEGLWRKRVPLPDSLKLTAPQVGEVRDLSAAARCYAAQKPDDAALLLESRAGGRGERTAVEKMLPDLMKCVPAGVRLNYPATLIRFRIAEALYRLGHVRPEPRKAG